MNEQKRYSLTTRLESREGSLLAEMTKWLNRMPIEEKKEKVKEALLMTYWPLVKADAGACREELEKCYWEFEQWFYRHRFVLRQQLNLQEPFHWEKDLTAKATKSIAHLQKEDDEDKEDTDLTARATKSISTLQEEDDEDESDDDEAKLTSLKSQLIGGGKVKNAGSIFKGFG